MKYQYYTQEPLYTVHNIDLQTVSRPKNYQHSFRNGRNKHGFIYVVSGQMYYDFYNETEENLYVSAGELLFVPKNSIYTGNYREDNTKIEIVQFDIAEGELPEYLSAPVIIEIPQAGECMKSFFRYIENHLPDHPFYYLSCLYSLLWQIDENYSKIPKKFKKLQPALAELSEYWNKNEEVAYYAALCDMSEVNFRRLFREYTGTSPIAYRNDIRLTNAKSKLQSGEYNVSEAAEICGFTNLSYFIRLYKKKFGCTPKKQ